MKTPDYYMTIALKEAGKAYLEDEVPIGAVAVLDGKILAKGHNRKEKYNDATRHAEMEVLKKCAKKLGNWYLENIELYVTLEPCAMCAGAMINARISKLYYGASDPKSGAVGSVYNIPEDNILNHKIIVEKGILAEECGKILSNFFKNKRKKATEI